MRTHKKRFCFKCHQCNFRFSFERNLRTHKKRFFFKCHQCNFRFVTLVALKWTTFVCYLHSQIALRFKDSRAIVTFEWLLGHSGQIGNAPNSAGKKSNSMLQLFSMHIWYWFEFLSMKKTKGKLKFFFLAFFPYQICDSRVPGWRRPFEDNFILKVVVSSFLSEFESIKLSRQHSTYVWLEF